MPEIRSVSVRLDADVASYIAKMKAAGEATDHAFGSSSRNIGETNTALKGTETELGKVDTAARKVDTSMRGLDQRNQSVTRSQDRLTGGMRILVNTALALGPALVPIGAVAIPAIAGLTSELGAAVIGVGVTELAFHGLGKALTAFNKAELSPTTANIQAAQTAMASLPPSAQALVLELHKLSPVLTTLRQSAASGLAPGVTSGLRSLLTDAPLVERGVHGIASELGDLTAQAGRALAGPEWRGFLRTVGQQTPVALHEMGVATGAVVHGLAQLYLAFGPSLGSFDQGVVKVADDFDRWATSLGQTKDFQSFMAYVTTNGPRVIGFLGDTADLIGSIVTAAAPLGGPTLEALDGIVKVLDAIAQSPLGTPILLLAQLNAAMHLTNNLLGVMGVKAKIGFGGITAGAATAEGATAGENTVLGGLRSQASLTYSGLRKVGLNTFGGAAFGIDPRTGQSTAVTDEERGALATSGLQAAGIGLIASGAARQMGLLNTITLATAGSLAGPWGAAVGGAVGIGLDWKAALDANAESMKNLQTQSDNLAQSNNIVGLAQQARQFAPLANSAAGQTFSQFQEPGTAFAAASSVSNLFNQGLTGSTSTVSSLTGLQQIVTRMQPAMAKLGITLDDLVKTPPAQLPALVDQLVAITQKSDTATGSAYSVAKAFAQMSDDSLTTADRVQSLTTALDNLIDPMLNLGAAHDAFRQGLNDIDSSLAKTNKSLVGNSDAAIQNRDAIRTQVTNLKAWIDAQAQAGAAPAKLTASLREGRQAIIDEGSAAGLNRAQIEAMIRAMGLTPHLIKTTVELAGVGQAENQLDALTRTRIAELDVRVHHTDLGIDVTGGHLAPADGVTVPGVRHPYGDRVPALLSPGEEVVSNRHGQADRHRGLLKAINANRMADGGTAGLTVGLYVGSGAAANSAQAQSANDAAHALHGLSSEAKSLTKVQSQEQAQLQKIQQARSSLVSTVRGGFLPQLFGTTAPGSSTWSANGGLVDPLHLVNQNIHQARAYTRDLHRLRGRGLRGAALAQVTTLADAHQALGLSPHEDRLLTQRNQVLERASRQAGRTAGDFRYGKQIEVANHHLADLKHEVHETNQRLHHLEQEQHKNAKTTGAAVAAGVNSGVTGGVRRQKPWT